MSGKLDLTIEQGARYNITVQIKDKDDNVVDITGDTFEGDIRKRHNSTTETETFTVSATDAANGKISITLSSTQTAAITAGEYFYDIHWTPSAGNTVRLLEGEAIITPGVTR